MKNLIAFLNTQRDLGLLLARILSGVILLAAGYGKLFGAGFSGVAAAFDRMGIFLPQVTGPFIALLEFFGGAALILGLFTRYVGILFTIEFIVAILAVKIGSEMNALRIDLALLAFGILWATHGPGRLSLDRMFNLGD